MCRLYAVVLSAGKPQRTYYPIAGFVLAVTTLLRDVASGLKWRWLRMNSPSPQLISWQIYYISRISVLTAHRKEVGRFWHCTKIDISSLHLFCKKGFLLKPLVEEFSWKWRFWPKICICHVTATSGPLATLGPTVIWENGDFDQIRLFWGWIRFLVGGGWPGSPSCLLHPPPPHRRILLFASFSLIKWHLPFFLDDNCSSWCSPSFWS